MWRRRASSPRAAPRCQTSSPRRGLCARGATTAPSCQIAEGRSALCWRGGRWRAGRCASRPSNIPGRLWPDVHGRHVQVACRINTREGCSAAAPGPVRWATLAFSLPDPSRRGCESLRAPRRAAGANPGTLLYSSAAPDEACASCAPGSGRKFLPYGDAAELNRTAPGDIRVVSGPMGPFFTPATARRAANLSSEA
jgi:hypothetical protein